MWRCRSVWMLPSPREVRAQPATSERSAFTRVERDGDNSLVGIPLSILARDDRIRLHSDQTAVVVSQHRTTPTNLVWKYRFCVVIFLRAGESLNVSQLSVYKYEPEDDVVMIRE